MHSMTAGSERAPSTNHLSFVVRFQDACRESGVSASTMRRLIKAGRGPRLLRLSERCTGFRRADLDAWLVSRLVEA